VAASIGPFIIVFRESLEAGLVTTVIFAYLKKINRQDLYRWGYIGVALSIAASLGLGYVLYAVYTGLTETFARIFEASAGIVAVAVLSYMIVWMAKSARKIKGEIQEKIDLAVTTGNLAAISVAAFTSVGREGLETVLFLAPFAGSNPAGILLGSFLGIVSITLLLYLLAKRIVQAKLLSVFKYTSLLVAVLAAGILYHTTSELSELLEESGVSLGLLSRQAYDLGITETSIFGEEGMLGGILHSFTGYMQSAVWLSVLSYLGYWGLMGLVLYRTYRPKIQIELSSRTLNSHARENPVRCSPDTLGEPPSTRVFLTYSSQRRLSWGAFQSRCLVQTASTYAGSVSLSQIPVPDRLI